MSDGQQLERTSEQARAVMVDCFGRLDCFPAYPGSVRRWHVLGHLQRQTREDNRWVFDTIVPYNREHLQLER